MGVLKRYSGGDWISSKEFLQNYKSSNWKFFTDLRYFKHTLGWGGHTIKSYFDIMTRNHSKMILNDVNGNIWVIGISNAFLKLSKVNLSNGDVVEFATPWAQLYSDFNAHFSMVHKNNYIHIIAYKDTNVGTSQEAHYNRFNIVNSTWLYNSPGYNIADFYSIDSASADILIDDNDVLHVMIAGQANFGTGHRLHHYRSWDEGENFTKLTEVSFGSQRMQFPKMILGTDGATIHMIMRGYSSAGIGYMKYDPSTATWGSWQSIWGSYNSSLFADLDIKSDGTLVVTLSNGESGDDIRYTTNAESLAWPSPPSFTVINTPPTGESIIGASVLVTSDDVMHFAYVMQADDDAFPRAYHSYHNGVTWIHQKLPTTAIPNANGSKNSPRSIVAIHQNTYNNELIFMEKQDNNYVVIISENGANAWISCI